MIQTVNQEFRRNRHERYDVDINALIKEGWTILHCESHTMAYDTGFGVEPHGWIIREFILQKDEK